MPLRVLYLLADPGIALTESNKGASIHARAMLDSFARAGHEVTCVCLRLGDGPIPSHYRVVRVEPGRLTRWYHRNLYRAWEAGQVSLGARIAGWLAQAVAVAALAALGLAIMLGARWSLGSFSTDAVPVWVGALSLFGAFPARLLARSLAKRLWPRRFNRGGSRPPNLIDAIYNLMCQADFMRAARAEVSGLGTPDLIYARNAWFAWPYARLARRTALPLVLEANAILYREREIRGEAALAGLARRIERRNFAAADLVLPVTDQLRAQVLDEGAAPERTITMENGVDLELFGEALRRSRLAPSRERFVVGLVSSFREHHGTDVLIEAAALLRESIPNLLVWIVGYGPEYDRVKALVAERGLGRQVRLEGLVEHELLPDFLAQFDVAVAPFRGESHSYMSPIKIMEYMAAGRPVVCSRWGVMADRLDHMVTALLHEPDQPQALADCLKQLHDDPELARRLVDQGRAWVAERSWDANLKRLLATLAEHGRLSPEALAPARGEDLERAAAERRDAAHLRRWGRDRGLARIETRQSWEDYQALREAYFAGAAELPQPLDAPDADAPDADALGPDAPGAPEPASSGAPDVSIPTAGGSTRSLMAREALPLKPPPLPPANELPGRVARTALARWAFNAVARSMTRRAERAERRMAPRPLPQDRPLKVLRLASTASVGGVAKVMNQTSLRMDPGRVQTKVIIFGARDHLSPLLTSAPGMEYVFEPLQLWLQSWNWRVFKDTAKLRRLIERERPDVIHLHEPQFGPMVSVAAARAGVPMVIQLHNEYTVWRKNGDRAQKKMERLVMLRKPLIGHAPNVINDAYRYIGFGVSRHTKPIALTEDGIDDLQFWGRDLRLERWIRHQARGRKILFLIARLAPHKRITDFMLAARLLMDEGHPVFILPIVYGAKKKETDKVYSFFYENFKPGEGEILFHLASPVDILPFVHACVSCSELEGIPKTFLEYMHHGVPIVCSDIIAHRQLVDHERTGLLYPVGDLPSLVLQLRRILTDDPLRERLVANARREVAHRRWARTAGQVYAVYRGVFAGGAREEDATEPVRASAEAPTASAEAPTASAEAPTASAEEAAPAAHSEPLEPAILESADPLASTKDAS